MDLYSRNRPEKLKDEYSGGCDLPGKIYKRRAGRLAEVIGRELSLITPHEGAGGGTPSPKNVMRSDKKKPRPAIPGSPEHQRLKQGIGSI